MGIVIDFSSRDRVYPSRHALPAEHCAQVVILPVIRIERYEDQPQVHVTSGRGDQARKSRRRASIS
jgi:hypothetical protein